MFPKALGTMASQVLKHLQESGADKNLIDDAKTFEAHRKQYWNQVFFQWYLAS